MGVNTNVFPLAFHSNLYLRWSWLRLLEILRRYDPLLVPPSEAMRRYSRRAGLGYYQRRKNCSD